MLRALALTVIAQSLVRQGHFAEAIQAYASAPRDLDGPGHIKVRTRILLGMGLACAHQCLPEQALRMGDAALRLAVAHEMTTLAAAALECVGVCHALQDDLTHADQLMHESLGLALQTGDETVVHRCLNNLQFLSQTIFDTYRQQGDADNARVALSRCARFAAAIRRRQTVSCCRRSAWRCRAAMTRPCSAGCPTSSTWRRRASTTTTPRAMRPMRPRPCNAAPSMRRRANDWRAAPASTRCLWRSNRAGWLLRRGLLVEAIADYDAVDQEAERHGWIVLARNARLDRALALRLRGRPNDAIAALLSLIRHDADSDTCDVNLRAHEALQELLQAAGRQREAASLAPAIQRIVGQRDAERATAIALLPKIGAVVDAAIAEADRLRVDAEAERAREHANDLRNAAFLNRP